MMIMIMIQKTMYIGKGLAVIRVFVFENVNRMWDIVQHDNKGEYIQLFIITKELLSS